MELMGVARGQYAPMQVYPLSLLLLAAHLHSPVDMDLTVERLVLGFERTSSKLTRFTRGHALMPPLGAPDGIPFRRTVVVFSMRAT